MPRYAMFDLYTDVIFSGGIQLTWFTETWGNLCKAMDKNHMKKEANVHEHIISLSLNMNTSIKFKRGG